MTDEQNAALEWLDNVADDACRGATYVVKDEAHARILKALLAEPRLPAEPEVRTLIAMDNAIPGPTQYDNLRLAYRALYAHLTAPKTKTVDVWRVEYALDGLPWVVQFPNRADAEISAEGRRKSPAHSCIHVTGPHKQEVPV